MRNPPILIAVLGFFAALTGFGFLFLGLRLIGFDWFGLLGDLDALEGTGLWGWLAVATGVVWLLAALGLWALQPWARLFVMLLAGFALVEAALTALEVPGWGVGLSMAVMPALILWYLTTADVKAAFRVAGEAALSEPDARPVAAPVAAPAPAAPSAAPAVAAAGVGAVAVARATAVDEAPQAPPAVVAAPLAVATPVAAAPDAAPADPAPAAEPARSLRIEDVEGIGAAYGEKLAAAGVATTDDLLAKGATRGGRANLAEATGISEHLVLEWVNNADLMRIPGVGTQYSDLLEAAGVDSPAELAQRNAGNLATTFQEVVAARPGTVRRIPSEAEVAGWIEAAKQLPKVVEH